LIQTLSVQHLFSTKIRRIGALRFFNDFGRGFFESHLHLRGLNQSSIEFERAIGHVIDDEHNTIIEHM
jgi:hypothetical protein